MNNASNYSSISQHICIEMLLPQDIALLSGATLNPNIQRAAFYTSKKWTPGTTITISFISSPPPNIVRNNASQIQYSNPNLVIDPLQAIVDTMDVESAVKLIVAKRIQPCVNLNFVFVPSGQPADITITFDASSGSWSYIGTDALLIPQGSATMNLGWFDVATTMHEFGHVLGMVHEHQNPKNQPIEWNVSAVYTWANSTQRWDQATAYTQIIEPYANDLINGSSFDPYSIMLYAFPASITLNNYSTYQNLILSPMDILYINQQYPNTGISKCGTSDCMSPQQFYEYAYNTSISSYPTLAPLVLTNNVGNIGSVSNINIPQINTATISPVLPPNYIMFLIVGAVVVVIALLFIFK